MSFNQNNIIYTISGNYLTVGTEDKEYDLPNALVNYSFDGTVFIPRDISYNNKNYRVTRVGNHAFKYSKLITVYLPNSITSIGFMAFAGSTIDYITVPASVTNIDFAAFHRSTITSFAFE